MSIPKLTADLAVIQKLSDLPNATDGLSAEELKAKFDEAAEVIQKWINEEFVPAIAAENIPYPPTDEINADNVAAAIRSVYEQIQNAASGSIVNGTVTKEKLSTGLLERVFGGRVWVSVDVPTEADNPSAEFPVGQLWMRPAHTVQNKVGNDWSGTGCSAEMDGYTLTMIGNQTVATVSAMQNISGMGESGDRVFVVLDVAEKDAEITSLTASFDGGEAFTLSGSRVYETVLNSSALTLNITAQWPSASLASGKVVLENVTVINPDALLRTLPAAHDRKNWEQWLRNTVPFAEVDSGRELFVQALPGIWQLFDQEVFPVSRGGTGISEVADGDMLVGKDGGFTALRKSDGSAFMYCDGEKPEWMGMDLLADFGYARFASGTYVGTGTENPITLPVEPKLLIINKPGKITNTSETDGQSVAVLQQGTSQAQNPGGSSSPYVAGIQLEGNTLTPYMNAHSSVENPKPRAWNENGVTYSWFAIY